MATHEAGARRLPMYVWEAPVRLWHWTMAACVVTLAITGYFIGTPPPSVPGEASENFLLGWIRFVHFSTAYVFAVLFLMRVYWAVVGNRFAREIFSPPLLLSSLSSKRWWGELIDECLYYAYLGPPARSFRGHDPLAAVAMIFMYVLGAIFMIVTGFALYGEGLGRESWAYKLFSAWVIPLFGQSQDVHTWHHLGMWYLVIFSIIHIYIVLRQDVFSDQTVLSTMVNGWRVEKYR
ncbi:MAG: Ni/Fe-hydrogenase, b-type cytochrome subunit [Burkholderiales bacterium]|jgi:Ni/Fe-hydrogenase 1 B-type cytochrome subunit